MSPSTVSNILHFLQSYDLIEFFYVRSETQDRTNKVYRLTPKGIEMAPLWKTLEETEREIMQIIKMQA